MHLGITFEFPNPSTIKGESRTYLSKSQIIGMFRVKKAFGFPIPAENILANRGFSKGNGFQNQQPTIRNYKGYLGAILLTISHGVLYHKIFFSKGEWTLYQLPKRAKGGPLIIPKGQVAVVANNPVRSFGA